MTLLKRIPKRWRIISLVLAALLVVWLFLGTRIVAAAANRGTGFGAGPQQAEAGPGRVEWGVDNAAIDGGLLSNVQLQGWAYSLSPAGDDKTETWLVLDSGTRRYQMQPAKTYRGDLTIFAGEGVAARAMGGLNAEFSPLAMADGAYRLCFRVEENGQLAGTAYTDYVLTKYRDDISVDHWQSLEQQPGEPAPDAGVLGDVLSAYVDSEGDLRLHGWAALAGEETAGQGVLVELRYPGGATAAYNTLKAASDELAMRLQNDAYRSAVFDVRLPGPDALPEAARVVLEKPDGTAVCGRWLRLGEQREDGALPLSPATPEPAPAAEGGGLVSSVRIVPDGAGGWLLQGYAYRPEDADAGIDLPIWAELTTTDGETLSFRAEAGTSPEYAITAGPAAAGHAVNMPLPLPPEALESVTLTAQLPGGQAAQTRSYRIALRGDTPTALAMAAPAPQAELPGDMAPLEAYNMDVAHRIGSEVQLEGWAVAAEPAGQTPYIQLRSGEGETTLYEAQTLPRLDIDALHEGQDALYTGFAACVSDPAAQSYRLILRGGDGSYAATDWLGIEDG